MPNGADLTPILDGATNVSFNVVVHTEHLVIDRLWTRTSSGGAWGAAVHTGDTAGDDQDDFGLTNVKQQQELYYYLLIETPDAGQSGDFDLEVIFTNGTVALEDGRRSEQGKVNEQGVAVVERLVRFQ